MQAAISSVPTSMSRSLLLVSPVLRRLVAVTQSLVADAQLRDVGGQGFPAADTEPLAKLCHVEFQVTQFLDDVLPVERLVVDRELLHRVEQFTGFAADTQHSMDEIGLLCCETVHDVVG